MPECCRKPAIYLFVGCMGERQSHISHYKRKGLIKISTLSSKERLFCTYYGLSRNGREAATKSGYLFPEKSAARLLKKKEVAEEIDRADKEKKARKTDVITGYYRLAFGCYTDPISLVFKEEVTGEDLQKMDLYNIAEIKRKRGGEIEIKFFDRLKALEHLEEIASDSEKGAALSLYNAIEKGAAALRDENDE